MGAAAQGPRRHYVLQVFFVVLFFIYIFAAYNQFACVARVVGNNKASLLHSHRHPCTTATLLGRHTASSRRGRAVAQHPLPVRLVAGSGGRTHTATDQRQGHNGGNRRDKEPPPPKKKQKNRRDLCELGPLSAASHRDPGVEGGFTGLGKGHGTPPTPFKRPPPSTTTMQIEKAGSVVQEHRVQKGLIPAGPRLGRLDKARPAIRAVRAQRKN